MYEGKAPFRPAIACRITRALCGRAANLSALFRQRIYGSAVGNLDVLLSQHDKPGGLPVYRGCLDELLEPFVTDRETAKKAIEMLAAAP